MPKKRVHCNRIKRRKTHLFEPRGLIFLSANLGVSLGRYVNLIAKRASSELFYDLFLTTPIRA